MVPSFVLRWIKLMVAKDQEERVCKGKTRNYSTQLKKFFIIIIKCHTCNYLSIMVQHYHNPQSGLLNHGHIKKVCYTQWLHHLCNIDNGYCMVNWSYNLGTNIQSKIYFNVHHHDVVKGKKLLWSLFLFIFWVISSIASNPRGISY
jgi:hypothetical protein